MKVVCPHCKQLTAPSQVCEACGRLVDGITDDTLRSIEQEQRSNRLQPNGDPYPTAYWHCAVRQKGHGDFTIENDLDFAELERRVLKPWHGGRPFVVGGAVVSSRSEVAHVFIKCTNKPLRYYRELLEREDAARRARDRVEGVYIGVGVYVDARFHTLHSGQDYTSQLLFESVGQELSSVSANLERESSENTMSSRVDVGVLSIKKEELDALLSVFPGREIFVHPRSHRHYNIRTIDVGGGVSYRLAIVRLIEQGTGEAQAVARDMLSDLSPQLILVVGIAGGVASKDFSLGDVVVATRVNDYTLHSKTERATEYAITGGPIARPIAAQVVNLPARLADLGDWTEGLPARPAIPTEPVLYGPPEWKVRVQSALRAQRNAGRSHPVFIDGVLGSSDGLIKDTTTIVEWIKTSRNLLAIDMESAGVYRAAQSENCAMLAIRGISDIVGMERDEEWTRYACATAASFARAYLHTRPIKTSLLP